LAHGDQLGPCALSKSDADDAASPADFALSQNHPNPFNPTTTITYSIPEDGRVQLVVFDLFGRKVAGLVDETKSAGTHRVTFEARALPSGVYIYQLQWNGAVLSRRMTILK
ncbi:MAG: T9SS type A sorting domain-containing protein, partial [Bacteroidota bacterium]|nr:T9SS type A sorting domain-containing protein [Bacteroidota bacterium]